MRVRCQLLGGRGGGGGGGEGGERVVVGGGEERCYQISLELFFCYCFFLFFCHLRKLKWRFCYVRSLQIPCGALVADAIFEVFSLSHFSSRG